MFEKFAMISDVDLYLIKMEGYATWFNHLSKWTESVQAADYRGLTPASLAVGDIVQQRSTSQHYR